MKIRLIVTALLLIAMSLWAQSQPLNGTYFIGGSSANFNSFTAAVSALTTNGVSGPVTFLVDSGSYNEQFSIGTISGASLNNPITFKGATGDSTDVTLHFASTSVLNNNYIVNIQNASFLHFEDLSFIRTQQNTYAQVININANSHDVSFSSCRFTNAEVYNTGIYQVLVYGILNGGQRNISFASCHFHGGNHGIYLLGPGQVNRAIGITIQSCRFEANYAGHLKLSYFAAPIQIKTNTMISEVMNANFASIYLDNCAYDYKIERNWMYIKAGIGIRLGLTSGYSTQQGLIANNYILSDTIGGANSIVTGLNISNSGTVNLYYNSIFLKSPYLSSKGMAISGLVSTQISSINNIIYLDSGMTMYVDTTAINPFSSAHHNNLFTKGPNLLYYGYSGSLASLSAYQNVSGLESNSHSVPINFLADGIHHNTAIIDDAGSAALSSLTPISVDFDGDIRHPSHPDIGADEFAHYEMTIQSIVIDTTLCTNQSGSIRIVLKNIGPGQFSDSLWIEVSIDSMTHPYWFPSLIQSVGANDTVSFLYDSTLQFQTSGYHLVHCRAYFHFNPISSVIDSLISDTIMVRDPITGFLGNDTIICMNHSFSLQPNVSFISYHWYDGSTQPLLQLAPNSQSPGILSITLIGEDDYCFNNDTLLLEVSECQGIEENETELLNIYPNPSKDHVTLKVPDDFVNSRILIINAQGEIVENLSVHESPMLLDISHLSPGFHHILVINSYKHMHCSLIKL